MFAQYILNMYSWQKSQIPKPNIKLNFALKKALFICVYVCVCVCVCVFVCMCVCVYDLFLIKENSAQC